MEIVIGFDYILMTEIADKVLTSYDFGQKG